MIALLRHYRSERLPLTLIATVTILLAAAAQTTVSPDPVAFASDAALAALLFIQLRVVDDIADRRADTVLHPERVTVRAASAWPFALLALALGIATAVWLSASGHTSRRLGAYLSGVAAVAIFYRARQRRSLLSDHLLLTKYPAMVWLVAGAHDAALSSDHYAVAPQLVLRLIATYLAACVYEALHDRHSPGAARPALAAGEGLLLILTLTALSLRGHV